MVYPPLLFHTKLVSISKFIIAISLYIINCALNSLTLNIVAMFLFVEIGDKTVIKRTYFQPLQVCVFGKKKVLKK